MVQFPGYSSMQLLIHCTVTVIPDYRVTPFGYLRFNGCLLLPAAFRSLPRPSSSNSSEASSVDPYSLDHITSSPSLFQHSFATLHVQQCRPNTRPLGQPSGLFERSYSLLVSNPRFRGLSTSHFAFSISRLIEKLSTF